MKTVNEIYKDLVLFLKSNAENGRCSRAVEVTTALRAAYDAQIAVQFIPHSDGSCTIAAYNHRTKWMDTPYSCVKWPDGALECVLQSLHREVVSVEKGINAGDIGFISLKDILEAEV